MDYAILSGYGENTYAALLKSREEKCTIRQSGVFLDMATRARKGENLVSETVVGAKATKEEETSNVAAYMEHLKNKYGQVTVESVGKDQASLEKVGRRMDGHDVVIAPNILEAMASDGKKAAYYEQKIDDFFLATPRLKAHFAAQGLTYEPCGVVIHEDGSVTYICGGGDSPERVAEVNRINREKAKKKAERQEQYQEWFTAAAMQHRRLWAEIAKAEALEKQFSGMNELLKNRMISAQPILSEVFLPAQVNVFFLGS